MLHEAFFCSAPSPSLLPFQGFVSAGALRCEHATLHSNVQTPCAAEVRADVGLLLSKTFSTSWRSQIMLHCAPVMQSLHQAVRLWRIESYVITYLC